MAKVFGSEHLPLPYEDEAEEVDGRETGEGDEAAGNHVSSSLKALRRLIREELRLQRWRSC